MTLILNPLKTMTKSNKGNKIRLSANSQSGIKVLLGLNSCFFFFFSFFFQSLIFQSL